MRHSVDGRPDPALDQARTRYDEATRRHAAAQTAHTTTQTQYETDVTRPADLLTQTARLDDDYYRHVPTQDIADRAARATRDLERFDAATPDQQAATAQRRADERIKQRLNDLERPQHLSQYDSPQYGGPTQNRGHGISR